MIEIELSEWTDFERLGELWEDLETRSDGSLFQSWAWVGCRAAQRFPHPLLVLARENGTVIALGLWNRRRRRGRPVLHLNESGLERYDTVFVEHNGILVERGRGDTLIADCLNQVLSRGGGRGLRLVLNGVPESYVAALRCGPQQMVLHDMRPAPFVDLAGVRAAGNGYLQHLSSNTRYQLGRSRRRYVATGPLTIGRPASVGEAQDFLSQLAALHQRYWTHRGKPGAFANVEFEQFHRALIERAFRSGGIDLLRICCGERAIGYLYNFRYRGTICAYQSGFDYSHAETHQRPGLTCHHLAIEQYLAEGAARYDFLAGDDRYKLSLATGAVRLYWVETRRRWLPPLLAAWRKREAKGRPSTPGLRISALPRVPPRAETARAGGLPLQGRRCSRGISG